MEVVWGEEGVGIPAGGGTWRLGRCRRPGRQNRTSQWLSGKVPLSLTPLSLTYVQSRTCRQTFMEELLGALLWGTPQGNKSTLGTVLGETPVQSRTLRNNRR